MYRFFLLITLGFLIGLASGIHIGNTIVQSNGNKLIKCMVETQADGKFCRDYILK